MTQVATRPRHLRCLWGHPDNMTPAYLRFLENQIRRSTIFPGPHSVDDPKKVTRRSGGGPHSSPRLILMTPACSSRLRGPFILTHPTGMLFAQETFVRHARSGRTRHPRRGPVSPPAQSASHHFHTEPVDEHYGYLRAFPSMIVASLTLLRMGVSLLCLATPTWADTATRSLNRHRWPNPANPLCPPIETGRSRARDGGPQAPVSPSVQVSGSNLAVQTRNHFPADPDRPALAQFKKHAAGHQKIPTRSRSTSMAPPPSSIYASRASTNWCTAT